LAGRRALAGKQNAKFTDAIWIVVLGIVINGVVGYFSSSLTDFGGLIATIIMFVVWLGLIKHFFDCGWLKAFAVAVVSVLIFIVIVVVLALIGLGIGFGLGFFGI
jgi:hypothetical protein